MEGSCVRGEYKDFNHLSSFEIYADIGILLINGLYNSTHVDMWFQPLDNRNILGNNAFNKKSPDEACR